MKVSKLTDRVQPSKGRQLFNLAAQYKDVINLTLGDPDIIPPVSVRAAGCAAIMDGKTRYSANAGLVELRKTYAEYLQKKFNREFDCRTQIAVTVGGMEALYLALISSVDPGDEVIIFAPYYINYYQMIEMCGGTPVVINTREENGFEPQLVEVEKAITEKTQMIIMNTPTNPTGAVYSDKTVCGLVNMAHRHDLLMVADEVYSTLVFGDKKYFSALNVTPAYENILFVDSCSKKFSMTGWRVGFAAGPEEWIAGMVKLQENVAACAPLPSQYAAIQAFREQPDMTDYVAAFEKRRDILVSELKKTNKLSFTIPDGTFYLFVNIEKTHMKSTDFAIELLKDQHVAVVPGVAYGNDFDSYVRIAFTLEDSLIEEAAKRIVAFAEKV